MQKCILTAAEHDGLKRRTISMLFKINKDMTEQELIQACKSAAIEFANTKLGRETYSHNCECFNWADFDIHVPNHICRKYGFEKETDYIICPSVEWDEQLVSINDINLSEEEENKLKEYLLNSPNDASSFCDTDTTMFTDEQLLAYIDDTLAQMPIGIQREFYKSYL